jgi:hypothetical protein
MQHPKHCLTGVADTRGQEPPHLHVPRETSQLSILDLRLEPIMLHATLLDVIQLIPPHIQRLRAFAVRATEAACIDELLHQIVRHCSKSNRIAWSEVFYFLLVQQVHMYTISTRIVVALRSDCT